MMPPNKWVWPPVAVASSEYRAANLETNGNRICVLANWMFSIAFCMRRLCRRGELVCRFFIILNNSLVQKNLSCSWDMAAFVENWNLEDADASAKEEGTTGDQGVKYAVCCVLYL